MKKTQRDSSAAILSLGNHVIDTSENARLLKIISYRKRRKETQSW